MAAITRRWAFESRSPCSARNASPWQRKMSATSSLARMRARLIGRDHREREAIEGLGVPAIRFVATCADSDEPARV
jgi:hypothetical protein